MNHISVELLSALGKKKKMLLCSAYSKFWCIHTYRFM